MEWRKQSKDNEKIWDASDLPDADFDVDANWQKLQERNAKGNRAFTPLRIAATVLLIAGIFSVIYLFTRTEITTISSAGVAMEVRLPDSSRVWLNAHSTISYNKKFGENDRQVDFDGEGFFEVRKDPTRPFVITTSHTNVEVVGTSFNLKTTAQQDELVVVTGKVRISNLLAIAGERVVGGLKDTPGSLAKFLSWKPKHLVFDRSPLDEVIGSIEAHYDVDIVLNGENIGNCRFSGDYINAGYEEIVEALSLTLNLGLTRSGNQLILSGDGCKE